MPEPTREPEHPEEKEKGQHDRAPYQKNGDRNAVKSAEETREIPNQHGAIK